MVKEFTELTTEANTHIEIKPIHNKAWGEETDGEVLFEVDIPNREKRVYKGKITLTGIIKK